MDWATHGGQGGQSARPGADLAVAAALCMATALYLSAMPHDLGLADESFFLYEAKRVRDGEVLYRDVFEIVAPLSWYVMALLFAVFGTTMETARSAMAALHGLIAAAIFLACRRLGITRGLGVVAAAAHVALCQTVWPYASPHWFATLLTVVLLVVLLTGNWAREPRRALVAGLVSGLLVGVQQQKGLALGAGICMSFVADHLLERWYSGERWRAVVLRLAHFAAGAILVIVPLFVAFAALAGPEALYEALIRFPLLRYHGTSTAPMNRSQWAGLTPLTRTYARHTLPSLLAALPLALLVPFLGAAVAAARRVDRERVRARTVLAVIASFSILSIAYHPDLIHVAFVAPILFIALADTIEAILGKSPLITRLFQRGKTEPSAKAGRSWNHWPQHIATALLLAGLTVRLGGNLAGTRGEFPVPYDSAFGRIDLREERDIPALDELRRLLDAVPSREIFAYPGQAFVYLVAGGKNPTRFQFFSPRYNDPAQIKEVLSILAAKKVPYVLSTAVFHEKGDPIRHYLRDHYERVRLPGSPRFWLLRRRPET